MDNKLEEVEKVLVFLNERRIESGERREYSLDTIFRGWGKSKGQLEHLAILLQELELAEYEYRDGHWWVRVTEKAVNLLQKHGSIRGYLEFLERENSLSPTINTELQQAQPREKPKSKSNHDIWDKIKYVSAIIGALGVVVGAIGKLFGLW